MKRAPCQWVESWGFLAPAIAATIVLLLTRAGVL